MSEAHSANWRERKQLGLVTSDNSGGYFVVECQGCDAVYPSFQCGGGEQIADTGDFGDSYCPHCEQVDPEECENVGLAWNTQQLKINALQLRLNAADQRIDELTSQRAPAAFPGYPPVSPDRQQPFTEQFIEDHLGKKPERIKGMIEAIGEKFAIMIDPENGHYGWTFKKHPDGMWVSGRKATDAEMHAARTHAHITSQQ